MLEKVVTIHTMWRGILPSFLIVGLSAFPKTVWAQKSGDYGLPDRIHKRVIGIEQDYESMIQDVVPEFRLIRSVETFPELSGNTLQVTVKLTNDDLARISRQNSPPVIAALHDRRTGKPLASCEAPCVMDSPKMPPAMLTIYRYGAKPEHYGSERYAIFDPPATLYLGFNEVDYQIIRDECASTFAGFLEAEIKRDAEPCYRLPPLMPPEARRSGHCLTTFDVSSYGEAINVVVEACTDSIFCAASLESVSHWIYHPAIEKGMAVERFAVESKVTYRLANESGALIPEPQNPDMEICIGSV